MDSPPWDHKLPMSDEDTGGLVGRLFGLAPELLCVTDAHGVVRTANPATRTLLGVDPDALVGRAVSSLVAEEDADIAMALFESLDESRPSASQVLRVRMTSNETKRIRWSVARDPVTDLCHVVAWDVTEKQRRAARYEATAQSSPTALIMVDSSGFIVLANRAARDLVAYTSSELADQRVEMLIPDEVRHAHPTYRSSFMHSPSERPMGRGRDLSVRRRDGTLVPVEIGLSPVHIDGELHTVVSLVDLTERKRDEQKIRDLADELTKANATLESLAVTDSLTGLWNRRKFFEESRRFLKLLQQTGGPFSLVLVDIDDFKQFNDRFGHLAGDERLRAVAEVIGEVRGGSDFSARYGGEEFVIALPTSDAEKATAVAERLRKDIASVERRGVRITVSVGVATLSDPGERGESTDVLLERLIECADRALYRSKAAGKNCVTHDCVDPHLPPESTPT